MGNKVSEQIIVVDVIINSFELNFKIRSAALYSCAVFKHVRNVIRVEILDDQPNGLSLLVSVTIKWQKICASERNVLIVCYRYRAGPEKDLNHFSIEHKNRSFFQLCKSKIIYKKKKIILKKTLINLLMKLIFHN